MLVLGLLCGPIPATAWCGRGCLVSREIAPDCCPADMRSILDGIRARQDAVITFNWDEELDCDLSTPRGGRGTVEELRERET